MRRRRKPLEVSTFPFLAVLLCAMGSLILVLLVMDRKAKMVARTKVRAAYSSAVAKASEEADKAAAAHRAELERRLQEMRSEWDKKRDALHSRLLTEQQALQLQLQQLHEKMVLAAARLRAEQEQNGELKKQVEGEQAKLQGETKAVTAAKATMRDTEKHTEQERAALTRMTNDLIVLEQALKDLKAAREREKQTYSVVPYRGKRGESRRPLYIECAGPNAIFHPDKKSLLVMVQKSELRAEVERRIARQREQIAASTGVANSTPYLMLLVRPDGIISYYAFQAALAGMNVQFGYELIDADWLLDFPPDDEQPSTQPWQVQAKPPEAAPPDAMKPGAPAVRGVTMGPGLPALPPLNPQTVGTFSQQAPAKSGNGPFGSATRSNNAPSAGGLGQPVALENDKGSGSGPDPLGPPGMPWETLGSGNPRSNTGPIRGYRGSSANDYASNSGQSATEGTGFGMPSSDGVRPGGGLGNGGPSNGIPALPTSFAQSGGGTAVPPWLTGSDITSRVNSGGASPGFSQSPTRLAQAGGSSPSSDGPWNAGNNNGNPGGPRAPAPDMPPLLPGQTSTGAAAPTQTGPGGAGKGSGSGSPPSSSPPSGPASGDAAANGTASGGSPPNGNPPGSTAANGTASGGSPPNGNPPGSTAANGTASGGSPPNGNPPGGMAGNGTASGGSPPNGNPPGGTAGNGTASGGSPPNGNPPGSTAANGTASGGSLPGGMPSNGASPPNMPPNGEQQPPPTGAPAVRGLRPGLPRLPGDSGGDPSDDGSQGGSRSLPATTIEPRRPKPPLRAARLNGDRDYIIFIECKRDGVVLYPAAKFFPLASLTNDPNKPLVQAVQLMIERRQSGVRPGEIPYRPQVRFLVRPETLRAYHAAYPLFDGLPIAQARQNLIPEDDVLSIVAGQR